MYTKRRTFLKQMGILGITSRLTAFTIPDNMIKTNNEIETFRKAQQKLLLKYHVSARSAYINLSAPRLKIHVLEAGHGEPVVMLHGGKATAAQFAPLMVSLQKDFRVYAPD